MKKLLLPILFAACVFSAPARAVEDDVKTPAGPKFYSLDSARPRLPGEPIPLKQDKFFALPKRSIPLVFKPSEPAFDEPQMAEDLPKPAPPKPSTAAPVSKMDEVQARQLLSLFPANN